MEFMYKEEFRLGEASRRASPHIEDLPHKRIQTVPHQIIGG